MKVILFNGPAGSGKDTAAGAVWDRYRDCQHHAFKDRLFEITAAIYGIPVEQLTGPMYTRENKEKPYKILGGLSPRQALIKVSEEVIKPSPLGHNFFGEALADSLESELTVVPDSGFPCELFPVIDRVGAENVLIVKILRTGYNFDNDSRNYLDQDKFMRMGVACANVFNDGTLEDFEKSVLNIVELWLGEDE